MKLRYKICFLLFVIFVIFSIDVVADQAPDTSKRYYLTVEGRSRNYILYVPPAYNGNAIPVVFDVHGWGGSATKQVDVSGFHDISKGGEDGVFAVAYPDGRGLIKGFNGSHEDNEIADPGCCGKPARQDWDDVQFFKDIREDIQNHMNASQFFYTGLSNGSYMGHRFLCENPGAFDAYGLTSAALSDSWDDDCDFTGGPKPILYIHGQRDTTQSIEEHVALGEFMNSVDNTLEIYKSRNNCDDSKTEYLRLAEFTYCYRYNNCDEDLDVEHCRLDDGHVTYDFEELPPANIWWDFFRKFIY